jgi:hypothetical protein
MTAADEAPTPNVSSSYIRLQDSANELAHMLEVWLADESNKPSPEERQRLGALAHELKRLAVIIERWPRVKNPEIVAPSARLYKR